MPRDKIYLVVEGHGEADKPYPDQDPAAKVLVAKMLQYVQCWRWFPSKRDPWRLGGGGFYPRTENLLRVLEAHKQFADCAAVLVLFDLEDDCPHDIGPQIATQIRERDPWPFSILVVCAYREYESWFLASLETIQNGHKYEGDPETRRDAKGWLERKFDYKETRDQATYTQRLDVVLARERSRSFERLCHAFEQLRGACENDNVMVTP